VEGMTMIEYEFVYDENEAFDYNFRRWYDMNCAERSEYKEKLYTREEGEVVFKDFIKHVH
jgi:hypothetical protein